MLGLLIVKKKDYKVGKICNNIFSVYHCWGCMILSLAVVATGCCFTFICSDEKDFFCFEN